MIRVAIAFFVLALIALTFGASGLANLSMEIGKVLLIVFLALTGVSLVSDVVTGKWPEQLP